MRNVWQMTLAAAALSLLAGCGGRDVPKENPVEVMVEEGDTAGLERIIKQPGVSDEALRFAAVHDQADLVPWLVDRGAKADRADADGMTPLHWAAMNGSTKTAEALLARGAKIDPRNLLGRTPLDEAVDNGHQETADLLKSKGGEPGAP